MSGLQSMTGFGAAASRDGDSAFQVTLRSVNHRHLDIVYRVPASVRSLTSEITGMLEGRFRRGRIEVAVEQTAGPDRLARLDVEAARWLSGLAEQLRREGVASGDLTVSDVLAHPAALRAAGADPIEVDGAAGRCLFAAVGKATDRLAEARLREGHALAQKIDEQVGRLGELVAGMRTRVEPATAELMARYRERIESLVRGASDRGVGELDDARLVQEAAILAERVDVAEELDRLEIHLEAARAATSGTDAAGRRLDFLAQEILRELNTVGSKSRDAELSALVVEGKVFCERLREQAQNVE